VRAGCSFFHIHCYLHEKWHFFSLILSACKLKSLFTEKLLVDEIVQGAILFKKLFVIEKIYCWEYSLEKVSSSKLFHGVPQTLLLLVGTCMWHFFHTVCTTSGNLTFTSASKHFVLQKTSMNAWWSVISGSRFFILKRFTLASF
jgi:hypothetical protein